LKLKIEYFYRAAISVIDRSAAFFGYFDIA